MGEPTARDRAADMTVADLTANHVGWLVRVHHPIAGPGPFRDLDLLATRRWTRPCGEDIVGLVDRNNGELPSAFQGTEYEFPAATRCELLRQVRKPRRRKAGARRG